MTVIDDRPVERVSIGDRVGFVLAILAIVVVAVLPVVWVLKMSLISRRELFASPPTFLPHDLTSRTTGTCSRTRRSGGGCSTARSSPGRQPRSR